METMSASELPRPEVTNLLSDFLSKAQFAQQFSVSEKTVDRWHVQGTGPSRTKIGRQVLYARRAIEEWLVKCEHRGDAHQHQRDRRRPRTTRRRAA